MTLGEYRVGIDFNPANNLVVREIKRTAADLIDMCLAGADKSDDPEVSRLWALAATHIEDGAMWAVKAVTKPKRE